MKKVCLFLVMAVASMAYADLVENFNTLTSDSWNQATQVVLPSGTWTMGGGAQYNSTNSVKSIKMNTNGAYLITPAVDSVQTLSFGYRAGGSSKKIAIAYAVGQGDWQAFDTITITSSSSSFATYSKTIGLDSALQVCIRITGITNNVFIDDVKLLQPKSEQPGGGGSDTIVVPGEDDPEFSRPTFTATHNTYYISPAGNDATGDGSFANPWYNPGKAVSVAQAGDVIYARGGRYLISRYGTDGKLTIRLSQSGTATAPIVISAYENEVPVFDFEKQLLDCNRNKNNVGDRGMHITGDYWILWGLHLMHAADNAIKLEGSHNRIERCEFSYNLDTGIQLGFGHKFSDSGYGNSNDGTHCAYNDIIDCDSHHNCDFDANYGSDADGFACKMHNGKGNRFIRCRAWRNADDAWDLFETDYDVVLYECWAWESGNAADHQWPKQYLDGNASFSGNGNGIKLGGNGAGGNSKGIHYAIRCVAFGCDKSSSVKGFDCNSHQGGHVIVNCLAFDNGYDYMFENGGSDANTHFYNNVCLGKQEICVGDDSHNAVPKASDDNAWTVSLVTNIGKSDYQSLDESYAIAPRRADGSMPGTFARLATGSAMVDAGMDVPSASVPVLAELYADYPHLIPTKYGAGWEIGPYEMPVINDIPSAAQQIAVSNQLNCLEVASQSATEALVRLSVNNDCQGLLRVYDLSGHLLQSIPMGGLISGMMYYQPIATLSSGLYLITLDAGANHLQTKWIK